MDLLALTPTIACCLEVITCEFWTDPRLIDQIIKDTVRLQLLEDIAERQPSPDEITLLVEIYKPKKCDRAEFMVRTNLYLNILPNVHFREKVILVNQVFDLISMNLWLLTHCERKVIMDKLTKFESGGEEEREIAAKYSWIKTTPHISFKRGSLVK